MNKKTQLNMVYAGLAVFVIILLYSWLAVRGVQVIPYSEFEQLLKDRQTKDVYVRQDSLEGTLHKPLPDGDARFLTTRVDPQLADRLSQANVKFTGVIENTWLPTLLSWVLPVLIFFAIWKFFFRRIAKKQGLGGMMSIGKSKAKVYVEKDTHVTFDDVAGVEEAKDELKEIVSFLTHPTEYGRLGARIPKGVLLVGPPGTGKTLLARAVAGEAGVPFFSISGSEFVEMFVGVGAARVRDLFEQASKAAPCIIFIDELDALGRARSIGPYGGHDEKEQTLNQLLSELDGFDSQQGVIILAATNRPEILDPALLRAGRFDRQLLVDRPDKTGRIDILKVHLKKVTLATDADPAQIAALTPGFSGADLAKASDIARNMVTRYGMSDTLGQMTYEEQRQSFLGQTPFTSQERQYSEETAREIDCAVRVLTEHARQQALYILEAFRKELEEGAGWLLEKETLLEDELPITDLSKLESTNKPLRIN